MKPSMKTILSAVAILASTYSFGQAGIKVTNATNASVGKTVSAAATTSAAASKGTVVRTTATTAAASKAAEVKTKSAAAGSTTATQVKQKRSDAETTTEKASNARVNSQASVHASEQAKANANENSAIFGTKGGVEVEGGATTETSVSKEKKVKGAKTSADVRAKGKAKTRTNK